MISHAPTPACGALLSSQIALKLKAASRPPFVPSDGVRQEVRGVLAFALLCLRSVNWSDIGLITASLLLQDIENAWAKLNDAETARYAALREELARQQKLQQLKTKFDSGASKLREWIAAKKEYLDKEEKVDSVAAAQTKLKILDVRPKVTARGVATATGMGVWRGVPLVSLVC